MKIDEVRVPSHPSFRGYCNHFFKVARRAAYQHMEATPEAIEQHLRDQPSGESVMGMVVGDETRLRQIITNLAR